ASINVVRSARNVCATDIPARSNATAIKRRRRSGLAFEQSILYKPGFAKIRIVPRMARTRAIRETAYGRAETKSIALEARHATLCRRAPQADLYRRQGFRRAAASASHRPEDRNVQGPPGPQAQGGGLTARPAGQFVGGPPA